MSIWQLIGTVAALAGLLVFRLWSEKMKPPKAMGSFNYLPFPKPSSFNSKIQSGSSNGRGRRTSRIGSSFRSTSEVYRLEGDPAGRTYTPCEMSVKAEPNEVDDHVVFTDTGGLRWSSALTGWHVSASWPFASVRITPQRLMFSVKLWKPVRLLFGLVDSTLKRHQEFVLEKDLVSGIHVRRGLVSSSLTFKHHSSGCPEFIKFYTFRRKPFVSELRRQGYRVN